MNTETLTYNANDLLHRIKSELLAMDQEHVSTLHRFATDLESITYRELFRRSQAQEEESE